MFDDNDALAVKSFLESVTEFLEEASSWLSEEDSPAVTTLVHLARSLDDKLNPPLVAQFGLTYRSLLKKRPGTPEEGDELDDLIPDSD